MKRSRRPFGFVAWLAAALLSAGLAPSHAQTQTTRNEAAEKVLAELDAPGRRVRKVPRKDGEFLRLLVEATGAKNALEIGTSVGYSAIFIALGLEQTGGKLTTIDIAPDQVRQAKENIAKAGLAHRVTCLEGDAHKVVRTLEGPFDFIFFDADKEGQVDYFNVLFPKLQPGGVMVCHNAIRHEKHLRDYLDLVKNHPQLDTVILSATMDDGFAVSYKRKTKQERRH
ncbi:MAG: O-methyltransferase [Verrucomicrobiae bacterium]|nr:O-methyltransferase [Verrucomicrobiae bacterium]